MSLIDKLEALQKRIERIEAEIGLEDGYSVCEACGDLFPVAVGRGRPRKYCYECTPSH